MVVLAGCGDGLPRPAATPSQRGTTSPRPSPGGERVNSPAASRHPLMEGEACQTLVGIDSLMWRQADSALKVMLEFAGSEEADGLDVFEGHYCQVLIAELLYKNERTHAVKRTHAVRPYRGGMRFWRRGRIILMVWGIMSATALLRLARNTSMPCG